MENVFKQLSDNFSTTEKVRETIRAKRDVAEVKIGTAQRIIAEIHVDDNLQDVADKALAELNGTGQLIKEIENALPDDQGAFYKYHDMWRMQLQSCAMVAVLITFIKEDTLVALDTVTDMMGEKVHMPLDEYLLGVCNSISELSRLSMNRVIKGDYVTPKKCARFATNLAEGMKQLNLKNDFLRKRYDGIKYDVKRLEEIVYDLTIRGLIKNKEESDIVTN